MRFVVPTLALAALAALAPVPVRAGAVPGAAPIKLVLTSTAFENDGTLPATYTCKGKDVPPPLAWTGVPADAKSLVLLVDDASRKTPWNHWIVWNIPPTTTGIPEGGALPAGAVQGPNDYQKPAWTGPCPTSSEPRTYYFQVFALDQPLGAGPYVRKALMEAMSGHVVAEGRIIAAYPKAEAK